MNLPWVLIRFILKKLKSPHEYYRIAYNLCRKSRYEWVEQDVNYTPITFILHGGKTHYNYASCNWKHVPDCCIVEYDGWKEFKCNIKTDRYIESFELVRIGGVHYSFENTYWAERVHTITGFLVCHNFVDKFVLPEEAHVGDYVFDQRDGRITRIIALSVTGRKVKIHLESGRIQKRYDWVDVLRKK